ncbi:MFS transporter [Rossellomorea vietnamensis]|uniref:MFS transporter n=1 Tax=Rossellomorea vietnamensis TaxID=218284 RepID=UPI001CCEAEBF|nr:MFS transporter [Rossellomorea vietnamensis]MCA0149692.1 MFS transporter [Rossellomorea vietnamensis]
MNEKSLLMKDLNFRNLWVGQTVSMFGSQITYFALPLIAAITLGVSSSEIGFLRAFEYLPSLLFGLFMGVYVDSLDKKKLLFISDVFRGLLLLSIPILFYIDALNIYWLWIFGFLLGFFTTLFEIVYMSYLPLVVKKEKLIQGNSLFELSSSVFTISGPSLAGLLIQFVTAPFALIIDGISFFISAIFIKRLRNERDLEETGDAKEKNKTNNVFLAIREGFIYIKETKFLIVVIFSSGLTNLANAFIFPVFMIYITQDLGLSPISIGFVFSFAGVGALIGAIFNKRIASKIGIGNTILYSLFLTFISYLFIPLGSRFEGLAFATLLITQFTIGLSATIRNINLVSVRMSITQEVFLGRVNSTFKFILLGVVPVGSILGGAIGELMGNQEAIIIGSFIFLPSLLIILFSKLSMFQTIDEISHVSQEKTS